MAPSLRPVGSCAGLGRCGAGIEHHSHICEAVADYAYAGDEQLKTDFRVVRFAPDDRAGTDDGNLGHKVVEPHRIVAR